MKLSDNFTYEEAIFSELAERSGIDNTPTTSILSRMREVALKMEEVRDLLNNNPILINSWYRSLKLNRALGSSDTSQHVKGEAIDFRSPKFGTPREIVIHLNKSNLVFDQLILEFDKWVHISFRTLRNRSQVLIIDSRGTRIFS